MSQRATTFTIGHSIHPIEMILGLLAQHEIALVVDVRIDPCSLRRWPQFNQAELQPFAGVAAGIGAPDGARRCSVDGAPRSASIRTALGSIRPSWRSGADHQTLNPEDGLKGLMLAAREARTAVMCSEGSVVAMPSADNFRSFERARMGSPAHFAGRKTRHTRAAGICDRERTLRIG